MSRSLLVALVGPAGSGKSTASAGFPDSVDVYDAEACRRALAEAGEDVVFYHGPETPELSAMVRELGGFVVRVARDSAATVAPTTDVDAVILNNDSRESLREVTANLVSRFRAIKRERSGAVAKRA